MAESWSEHLTDQHRQLLQAVADLFRRSGTWPTLNQIDRPLLACGINAVNAIKTLPDGLLVRGLGGADPARHDLVPLTLRGLTLCENTKPDVDLFLAITRWAATIDTEFDPGDDPPRRGPPDIPGRRRPIPHRQHGLAAAMQAVRDVQSSELGIRKQRRPPE